METDCFRDRKTKVELRHTPFSSPSQAQTQSPQHKAPSPLELSSLRLCLRGVSHMLCPTHPHASQAGWVQPSLANTQPVLCAPKGLGFQRVHTRTLAHACQSPPGASWPTLFICKSSAQLLLDLRWKRRTTGQAKTLPLPMC